MEKVSYYAKQIIKTEYQYITKKLHHLKSESCSWCLWLAVYPVVWYGIRESGYQGMASWKVGWGSGYDFTLLQLAV